VNNARLYDYARLLRRSAITSDYFRLKPRRRNAASRIALASDFLLFISRDAASQGLAILRPMYRPRNVVRFLLSISPQQ